MPGSMRESRSRIICISTTRPTLRWGAQMARWRYENGVTGDTGSFVVDNITACLEMVKRGLGWALIPEVALDNFDGCVRPCTFENGEPFLRRTYIFCQRDAAALPQVQLFMDMLKKKR